MADVVAGRYELERLIGTGGNGRVFCARDRVLDRLVAVKLVDAEAVRHRDPAGRERFLDEARSSAGFAHPNAVAVFDAGEADGSLYLVMELVEGETLADRIANSGPLEPTVAARVAADVLAALDAAHAAGIVHRDVKPANVLLDGAGNAKLADFGIAKRLDSVAASLTNPGQFFGTPKYLAPEQVDGRPVSAATDVYATGVVLFEMLAGRAPFDEGQPMATALAQRDAPVPDLRLVRADLPDALISITERALQKEPADRFESAAAMRAALTAPLWPAPAAVVASDAVEPGVVSEPTMVMAARDVAPTSMLREPHSPPTAVLVQPDRILPPMRRRRPARVLAAVLVVLGLGALVAALALRESGSDPPAEAGSSALPGDTSLAPFDTVPVDTVPVDTAPVDPPTTVPVVTVPMLPSDVPTLIEFLVRDPAAAGARGSELLEELRGILDRNGKKQRQAAAELADDVETWLVDDEIDPAIASLTLQILERLVGEEEDDD